MPKRCRSGRVKPLRAAVAQDVASPAQQAPGVDPAPTSAIWGQRGGDRAEQVTDHVQAGAVHVQVTTARWLP